MNKENGVNEAECRLRTEVLMEKARRLFLTDKKGADSAKKLMQEVENLQEKGIVNKRTIGYLRVTKNFFTKALDLYNSKVTSEEEKVLANKKLVEEKKILMEKNRESLKLREAQRNKTLIEKEVEKELEKEKIAAKLKTKK